MSDDPTPGTPPAGTPGSTSTPGGSTTTPPDAQAADGQEPISLDEARKLRREAQELRRRIKAYDDAQAASEAAKLTENERLSKDYADLQAANEDLAAALMEANVNQDIARHASKFNFAISADLIARMLEWSEIDWDEETGRPTNIERLLERLAKAAPNLIGRNAPSSSGGATNPSRSASGNFPQITRDNLSEAMAQYDKLAPAQQREVTRLLTGR